MVGQNEGGFLNTLINKLPFEMHLPFFNYCGPGTKIKDRLIRKDKPINELDKYCLFHDIAYLNKDKGARQRADLILKEGAKKRLNSPDSKLYEKLAAFLVQNAMSLKGYIGSGLEYPPRKSTTRRRKSRKKITRKIKRDNKKKM